MSWFHNLNSDVQNAIKWFAAEFKYLKELRDELEQIKRDKTVSEQERDYRKVRKAWSYIIRCERRAERNVERIVEELRPAVQTNPNIASLEKQIEISSEKLLKAFSFYAGDFKKKLDFISIQFGTEKRFFGKKAEQAASNIKITAFQIEQYVDNLIVWVSGLEASLSRLSRIRISEEANCKRKMIELESSSELVFRYMHLNEFVQIMESGRVSGEANLKKINFFDLLMNESYFSYYFDQGGKAFNYTNWSDSSLSSYHYKILEKAFILLLKKNKHIRDSLRISLSEFRIFLLKYFEADFLGKNEGRGGLIHYFGGIIEYEEKGSFNDEEIKKRFDYLIQKRGLPKETSFEEYKVKELEYIERINRDNKEDYKKSLNRLINIEDKIDINGIKNFINKILAAYNPNKCKNAILERVCNHILGLCNNPDYFTVNYKNFRSILMDLSIGQDFNHSLGYMLRLFCSGVKNTAPYQILVFFKKSIIGQTFHPYDMSFEDRTDLNWGQLNGSVSDILGCIVLLPSREFIQNIVKIVSSKADTKSDETFPIYDSKGILKYPIK